MTGPDAFRPVASLPASQRDHVIEQLAIAFPAAVEAAVKFAQMIEQGAASPANPYGSYAETKHGQFDAPSAADVAEGVEPHPDGEPNARELAAGFTLAPLGHLRPDHEDCECAELLEHDLYVCSCRGYALPVPTAMADASRLAGHMPEGAL